MRDNLFDDDEELSEEEEDRLRDEYEFYDEWADRDPELESMSLHDYNESRCVECYGSTSEELESGDEDW